MAKTSITNAQQRRFELMQHIGCIPCILEGEIIGEDRWHTPGDINHLLEGYRLGHFYTVMECPWHHRGVPHENRDGVMLKTYEMSRIYGPSRARNKLGFNDRYGSVLELLGRQVEEVENVLKLFV